MSPFQDIKKIKSEVSRKLLMQTITGVGLGMSMASPSMLSAMPKSANNRKVVRVFLGGAMTHLDSFDPKPQSPEVMGNTKTIKTNTGQEISAYFPKLAKQMDKFALIRSMTSPEADHMRAQYLNKTSYPVLGTTKHPDFGAWILKMRGALNSELPAIVNMSSKTEGGYLGTDFDSFGINNPSDPLKGLIMNDIDSKESLELLKLMANVRRNFHKNYNIEQIESYRSFYNDSIKFMNSKHLVAFDINKEDKKTIAKYNIKHGSKFLLARRLLEANVQYIAIGIGGWDDHFNLWEQENFPTRAKELDEALAVFIQDLYDRGLDKEVIFTVNTDFGRKPYINEKGRDHHRHAFSAIIGGAGINNGLVYGKTDDKADRVVENPVLPNDFNATLAKLVGLNLEKEIYSPDNRPFTVARSGRPVEGVMS